MDVLVAEHFHLLSRRLYRLAVSNLIAQRCHDIVEGLVGTTIPDEKSPKSSKDDGRDLHRV